MFRPPMCSQSEWKRGPCERMALTGARYGTLLGCDNIDLTNTSDYYARFTTSVICNAIIQNSISDCDLSGDATRPLCAESCVSDPDP